MTYTNPDDALKAAGGTTETHRPLPGRQVGRLRLLNTEELTRIDARDYLLKGIISPAELSVWYGLPKVGKTFLAMHVGYAVGQDRVVFGRPVHQVPVLYVVAEGEAGIAARVQALRNEYGPSDFHVIAQPADILHSNKDKGDLRDLIEAARQVGAKLIFLDTLNRLIGGGDENGPTDMGGFVANVTDLMHATNAHVSIIHHPTQLAHGMKPRGHTSLSGAADLLLAIASTKHGTRTATVTAARNDPEGTVMRFRMREMTLGTDEDEDPITTCLVDDLDLPEQQQTPGLELYRGGRSPSVVGVALL